MTRSRPLLAAFFRAMLPLMLAAAPVAAQQRPDPGKPGDEAVRRAVEYLRINTTNPPGNEDQAMRFFARILA
ncbi:MAG TPA: hypothetical protein VLD58_12230, partial [Gemmatimonadales bacterium]|nr:hypothetical protein [Gemmatimonadales bacterium]